MKNIDKNGKKETKLELSHTVGVLSSQNLHPNGIFNLNRGVTLYEVSAKLMFLDVQIDSYFAQPIFSCGRVRENRPFSRPFYFRALFLRENKRRAKIKGIKVISFCYCVEKKS